MMYNDVNETQEWRGYFDHYRQTPLKAYVVQPLKRAARRILSDAWYRTVRDSLGLSRKKPSEPLSPHVLEQYQLDDVHIHEENPGAGLDFLAVCRKEEA